MTAGVAELAAEGQSGILLAGLRDQNYRLV